jgi:hypothetical protein
MEDLMRTAAQPTLYSAERLGIDRSRDVRVLSSAASSEVVADHHENHDVALTRVTTERALADAGVAISEVDIVELHDA